MYRRAGSYTSSATAVFLLYIGIVILKNVIIKTIFLFYILQKRDILLKNKV